jgi:hypothetical protein
MVPLVSTAHHINRSMHRRRTMTIPPLRKPEPPTIYTATDHDGQVILWIQGGFHPAVNTDDYGTQPAVRGTVVMLTGKAANTAYDNVMLWRKTAGQFASMEPGEVALCRIAKSGKGVVYNEGAEYDESMAEHWMSKNANRLDLLRKEAVRSYREACKDPKNGPPPPVAQHFTSPAAGTQPMEGDQPLPFDDDKPGY